MMNKRRCIGLLYFSICLDLCREIESAMASKKLNTYNMKLKSSGGILVCGPSGSGKTNLVRKLIEERAELFENGELMTNVCYFYELNQPQYDEMAQWGLVDKWIKGAPTNKTFLDVVSDKSKRHLVILDGNNNM